MGIKIKAFFLSILLLSAGVGEVCAQMLDSTVRVALDRKMAEYFEAIRRESTDVQAGECDFLIETCTDSLMRQHVALTAYEHYRDSKVMGTEAVAIHIFDKWFADGTVSMRNGMEFTAAKIFAEFNRSSLIGSDAPELILETIDGDHVTIFGEGWNSGRFSILYFYDTSCATCRLQTMMLRLLLEEEDFPVDMYAVYAADDREAWTEYVSGPLSVDSPDVHVTHMWDPELSSDFQRKYGVIQTPRLFLITPDGTVAGRGLDAEALSLMLHSIFDEVELEYGSEESFGLYDRLFGESPSAEDIADITDYMASGMLAKGDTVMFRQMAGDLMYYLSVQRGEGCKEGLDYLINTYILNRGDVWKSADDSLKVIGMAEMYDDLLSRSAPGKRIPDMKLPGERLSSRKAESGEFRLRGLRGEENYIMFITEGCNVCDSEKAAAAALAAENRKVRVLMVNMDEILTSDPQLAGRLFDSFDLSALPLIIQTDRKGYIVRRYLTFLK